MTAKHVTLIYCDEARLGTGTEDDPIRMVQQLWTVDGELIATWDYIQPEGRWVSRRGLPA